MNRQHTSRDIAFYIAGFTDGEGSFNVSFRKRDDYLLGWKITPVFNISQKEKSILALVKHHLECGTLRFRKDGVWVYEVENKMALRTQVIPFFRKHPFLSEKKKRDFFRFQRIIQILDTHNSTTCEDLQKILTLLEDIVSKHARKYGDAEILERAGQFWLNNHHKITHLNTRDVVKGPHTVP